MRDSSSQNEVKEEAKGTAFKLRFDFDWYCLLECRFWKLLAPPHQTWRPGHTSWSPLQTTQLAGDAQPYYLRDLSDGGLLVG